MLQGVPINEHYLVGDVILPLVTVGVTGVVALWTMGFRDLLGFSVWSIVSGFHVEDVTDPKKCLQNDTS